MKIAGIDFPDPLWDALRNRRLVVFAGAGLSMGKPAKLPDFGHLAKEIANGERMLKGESEDRFLGRLHHQGVNVHQLAAEILKRADGLLRQAVAGDATTNRLLTVLQRPLLSGNFAKGIHLIGG